MCKIMCALWYSCSALRLFGSWHAACFPPPAQGGKCSVHQGHSCVFGPLWCWKCTFPCHLDSAKLGLRILAQGLQQLICACTACVRLRCLQKRGLASALAVMLLLCSNTLWSQQGRHRLARCCSCLLSAGRAVLLSEQGREATRGDSYCQAPAPQKSRPEYVSRTSRDT